MAFIWKLQKLIGFYIFVYTDYPICGLNVTVLERVYSIIIIIILVINFMQGICNYIPETNHVSRIHNVAAVLYLQSVLHVMLFRLWNVFCTSTLALPAICVQCPIWLLSVVPYNRAVPVCCSGTVWVILTFRHRASCI
jgi:hypothetical protein